jgi:hypothetical protein
LEDGEGHGDVPEGTEDTSTEPGGGLKSDRCAAKVSELLDESGDETEGGGHCDAFVDDENGEISEISGVKATYRTIE